MSSRATLHLKTTEHVMSSNGSNGNGSAAREHSKRPAPLAFAVMLERVNKDGDTYFVGSSGLFRLLMRATGETEGSQPTWLLYMTQNERAAAPLMAQDGEEGAAR